MADEYDGPASAAPGTQQRSDIAFARDVGGWTPALVREAFLDIDDDEGGNHANTLANHWEAISLSIETPVAAYATSSLAAKASTRLTRPTSLHAAPSVLR